MSPEQREAIRAMLLRRTGEHTQTSEAAEQWLIDEGLLDQEGRLRPQYGGDGKDGTEI